MRGLVRMLGSEGKVYITGNYLAPRDHIGVLQTVSIRLDRSVLK